MGFFEILLIAIIALLVVGPERMPEAVHNVALTIGRIKRNLASAREEFERQIGAEDIRRQLHNEAVLESIHKIKGELPEIDKHTEGKANEVSRETTLPNPSTSNKTSST